MKHHRRWLFFLLFALVVLALYFLTRTPDPIDYVAEALSVRLPRGVALETVETHGGFQGDGHTYIVIQFEEDITSRLTGEYWHDLPMSQNVSTVFYGGKTETMTYGAHLLDASGAPILPEITSGRYYFCDRHSESTNPAEDSELFSRASYNYTAAVYDADTKTLHYFKFDT